MAAGLPGLPVPYTHLVADFYKGIDEQGPYYNVQYLFDRWADSDTVVNAMRGYTQRVGGTTIRVPPHAHPLSPNLYCISARVVPASRPSLNTLGYPVYDGGFVVEGIYRSSSTWGGFTVNDDPGGNNQIEPTQPILWCTQELDFATETYAFGPSSAYTWSDLTTPANIQGKVTIGVTTMVLTFFQLPYLPMGPVRACRGKVNNSRFLGADSEKVMFLGGRSVREVQTDGTISQKIQLTFKERDVSWQKFFNPTTTAWENVFDSAGNKIYDSVNLNQLVTL